MERNPSYRVHPVMAAIGYLKTKSVNCEFLFAFLGKLSYETLPIGITLIRCFQSSRSKMSKI